MAEGYWRLRHPTGWMAAAHREAARNYGTTFGGRLEHVSPNTFQNEYRLLWGVSGETPSSTVQPGEQSG